MTPDDIRKAQGARLKAARKSAGFKSARAAARRFRWPESSVRAHEGGTRTIGHDDAQRYAARYRTITAQEILFGEDAVDESGREMRAIPVMGMIGAGSEIEPEAEQVPPDGLFQVDILIDLPDEMIAFEVRGESMLPRYDSGDLVVCYRDQRRRTEDYIGQEAAVRTADGYRYLKRIRRGYRQKLFNLESFNANTIENVAIEWVGEIWGTVRADQVHRISRRQIHRSTSQPRDLPKG